VSEDAPPGCGRVPCCGEPSRPPGPPPPPQETQLKAPEIKKWLNTGALPSETVERLLKKAMIIVD